MTTTAPDTKTRADAIREILVNTFKISSKRLQSLGLGEEQFIDQAHPTSPVNLQIQIMTVGKVAESEQPSQTPATPPSAPASVSAPPCLRLRIATLNGATASGHLMPASSWNASMMAATRRDTPTP